MCECVHACVLTHVHPHTYACVHLNAQHTPPGIEMEVEEEEERRRREKKNRPANKMERSEKQERKTMRRDEVASACREGCRAQHSSIKQPFTR